MTNTGIAFFTQQSKHVKRVIVANTLMEKRLSVTSRPQQGEVSNGNNMIRRQSMEGGIYVQSYKFVRI